MEEDYDPDDDFVHGGGLERRERDESGIVREGHSADTRIRETVGGRGINGAAGIMQMQVVGPGGVVVDGDHDDSNTQEHHGGSNNHDSDHEDPHGFSSVLVHGARVDEHGFLHHGHSSDEDEFHHHDHRPTSSSTVQTTDQDEEGQTEATPSDLHGFNGGSSASESMSNGFSRSGFNSAVDSEGTWGRGMLTITPGILTPAGGPTPADGGPDSANDSEPRPPGSRARPFSVSSTLSREGFGGGGGLLELAGVQERAVGEGEIFLPGGHAVAGRGDEGSFYDGAGRERGWERTEPKQDSPMDMGERTTEQEDVHGKEKEGRRGADLPRAGVEDAEDDDLGVGRLLEEALALQSSDVVGRSPSDEDERLNAMLSELGTTVVQERELRNDDDEAQRDVVGTGDERPMLSELNIALNEDERLNAMLSELGAEADARNDPANTAWNTDELPASTPIKMDDDEVGVVTLWPIKMMDDDEVGVVTCG